MEKEMKKNKFLNFSFLCLLILFLFASCKKKETPIVEETKKDEQILEYTSSAVELFGDIVEIK